MERESGAPPEPASLPEPIRKLVETLAAAGHPAWLVGGSVRDLVRGLRVKDFDVATTAPAETVLALFPRAVPIGIRHGTVMVPTPCGPVDVTTLRAGPRIEDDLAHRDFTVNAMAWDVRGGALIDPFDGRGDLARRLLRAVGSARERLAEDPLRAVRAARFAATLGFDVDAELESALGDAGEGLRRVAPERIQAELGALLLAPGAAAGIALLRRSGLEAVLLADAAADAAAVVPTLPPDLALRLAAWLRGGKGVRRLRLLRFPRRTVDRVERLLRDHPVELAVSPERPAAVRRLLKRVGDAEVDALVALRRAELAAGASDPAAERRLDALEAAIAKLHRSGALALQRLDLAIGGSEVMEQLGCGPGPQVGAALAWLTDRVVEDPACNEPAALRALLEEWSDSKG